MIQRVGLSILHCLWRHRNTGLDRYLEALIPAILAIHEFSKLNLEDQQIDLGHFSPITPLTSQLIMIILISSGIYSIKY